MNIIVVGCGKMGKYVSQILSEEDYNVTVIDKNELILNKINNDYDISVLEGNGLDIDTLVEANVSDADILISTMKKDEDNILCALIAKKAGVKNTIARVRNPEYSKSINFIKNELGLSMSINPELLTAEEITNEIRFPDNSKTSYLSKGKVQLVEFKLKDNSPLIGMSVKNIKDSIKKNLIVVAVKRNDKVYVPNGDFVFEVGDKIVVTSTPKNIIAFLKESDIDLIKVKNAMIIGGSKVSYYLAQFLSELNIKVKILENDLIKCELLSEKLENVMIINGDGSDKNLLLEEGIEDVDVLINATGMDEENVVFSMFGNSINIPKIFTKINHLNFVEVLDKVGIDTIVTPHVIASNHILRYVRSKDNSKGGSMESLIRLMNDDVEIMEFSINNDFKKIGECLKNIKFKDNLIVVSINRKGNIIFASGDDTIELDDKIVVATTKKGIKGLNDILG